VLAAKSTGLMILISKIQTLARENQTSIKKIGMDSKPMTWTIVASCGLEVFPKPLANGRVFHAFDKLQTVALGHHTPQVRNSANIDPAPTCARAFINTKDQ
jgi:hypothetical protein